MAAHVIPSDAAHLNAHVFYSLPSSFEEGAAG